MMTVKLKDLVDFSNGYAFKSSDYVEHSNTVNCRMSNIRPDGSFDIEYNIKYLPDEFAEKYSGFILNDGDIIIAMTDMAGDPKILGVPTLVNTKGYSVLMNQRVGKLTLKSKDIHPTYLKYYLMSNYARNYFKSFAGGGVQLNIGQKEILNIDIKLCDMKEQVEICNVLDKINVLIQQNSKQIEKFDQLVKSRFIEMFGDPLVNDKCYPSKDGKSLFAFSSGKFLCEAKRKDYGIPVYGGNGIAWHTDDALIDFPTIIIGRVGAYCGNVRIVKEPVWITDNAIYIKEFKTNEFNLDFLYMLMTYLNFSQYADFSGQPKVTQKPLENVQYIIPPIDLQSQFAEFVEQTDKSKFAIQQSLDNLETLKKALMQKYFG